ncbi:MAG: hypothetical protein IJT65_03820 [Eubacterium sp.]|nr:hypothetical protein [Eubacterium sp.]
MHNFRKKQKRVKIILNSVLIITAVYILAFIGAEPYIQKSLGSSLVFNYIAQLMIVVSLVFLFIYYSRFSKADKYIENAEYIVSDCGYYLTSRPEKNISEYYKAVFDDLKSCGFHGEEKVEVNELEFDFAGFKAKEGFYITVISEVDRNDIIAYIDSAIYDATALKLKRKGDCVVLFICDKADDEAIALSKNYAALGRKEQLKFAAAICEVSSKRVYFLGNKPSVCEKLITNYVMNCELPLKEEYKGKEKLEFQIELEKKLSDFNIKSFKEGKYNQ